MILSFFVSTDMDIKYCLGGHQNHHKFLSAFFFLNHRASCGQIFIWHSVSVSLEVIISKIIKMKKKGTITISWPVFPHFVPDGQGFQAAPRARHFRISSQQTFFLFFTSAALRFDNYFSSPHCNSAFLQTKVWAGGAFFKKK